MCGIAGLVATGSAPVRGEALKAMCDALVHRGPDDAGYLLGAVAFSDPEFARYCPSLDPWGGDAWKAALAKGPPIAMGHRRLSILDVSPAGHQPMAGEGGASWVVYNGEIYNFRELRASLEKDGLRFKSASDTEVLVALWRKHGADSLSMLNGMFAFALWDAAKSELVLARDRFGVKPLYWAKTDRELLFASETKAILASKLVAPKIDPAGVQEYFTFQNIFGTNTLFAGVSLLEPGSMLTLKLGSASPSIRRWASPMPTLDPSLGDDPALTERVRDAFARAVERQLVSDVEVGSYLSGGMDSGSIVAVTRRFIPRLLTFTCGFDLTNVDGLEQGFDERRQAERLSSLLQTEHYDVVLHAGDMPAAMERLTWHMDDPRVGMCHPNWYISKLAGKFVKVCLSGGGGDELFGGYPWRYKVAESASTPHALDNALFEGWHRLLGPTELPGLFRQEVGANAARVRASFDQVMGDAPAHDGRFSASDNLLQRIFHFERKTFLHGLLVAEDHVSMGHSLEVRVPFLDEDLASLAWRIPPSRKVTLETSGQGKRVLREAMSTLLPREFTEQRKQGFSAPDENWYRGPSMDYIKQILLDPKALAREWFDAAFVQARLEEHFQGRRNHRLLIWSLLSFEWLQRHYVDA